MGDGSVTLRKDRGASNLDPAPTSMRDNSQAVRKSSRFYVPALDGLRFVAFALVFFHHLPECTVAWMRGVQRFSALGVDLFFCLSGFLLTTLILLERSRTGSLALGRFFLRRILRIWPLYFFMLALGFVVFPLLGLLPPVWGSVQHRTMVEHHLLPFLTFLGNVSSAVYSYPPSVLLNLLWSISAEEQFYLALPGILMIASRWPSALAVVLVTGLALRAFLLHIHAPQPVIWVLPIARPEPFVVGMALGMVALSGRDVVGSERRAWVGVLLLLTLLGLASSRTIFEGSWTEMWQYPFAAAAFGIATCLAYAGRPAPIARFLRSLPMVWLGRISFGLYVYHLAIIHGLRVALGPVAWPVFAATAMASTIVVAGLSYVLLERPFLRLKARYEVVPSRIA